MCQCFPPNFCSRIVCWNRVIQGLPTRCRISKCFDRTSEVEAFEGEQLIHFRTPPAHPPHIVMGRQHSHSYPRCPSSPTLLSLAHTMHARRPRTPGSPYGGAIFLFVDCRSFHFHLHCLRCICSFHMSQASYYRPQILYIA
jgi:hypothetical protein